MVTSDPELCTSLPELFAHKIRHFGRPAEPSLHLLVAHIFKHFGDPTGASLHLPAAPISRHSGRPVRASLHILVRTVRPPNHTFRSSCSILKTPPYSNSVPTHPRTLVVPLKLTYSSLSEVCTFSLELLAHKMRRSGHAPRVYVHFLIQLFYPRIRILQTFSSAPSRLLIQTIRPHTRHFGRSLQLPLHLLVQTIRLHTQKLQSCSSSLASSSCLNSALHCVRLSSRYLNTSNIL